MTNDRGAGQDTPRTDAENRVVDLMDALEQSIAAARKARNEKVLADGGQPCVICDQPTKNTIDGPEGVEPMCHAHANEWIEDHR